MAVGDKGKRMHNTQAIARTFWGETYLKTPPKPQHTLGAIVFYDDGAGLEVGRPLSPSNLHQQFTTLAEDATRTRRTDLRYRPI